jgi:hypothetical protein
MVTRMVSRCGSRFALVHDTVWSHGIPAGVVHDYDADPELGPALTLFLDRERDYDETSREEYALVCRHCLIDEHPELGRAIDLAKRTGSAYRVDGDWRAEEAMVSA